MQWYILKVQSNREDSIREGLLRRVAVAGMEPYFGEAIVPTERVTEIKGGKKRVVKRKLFPGYLVVQMEINDDTWFLVRETPGIGDFTGAAGRPTPMEAHEVSKLLASREETTEAEPRLKIDFKVGDRVRIKREPWASVNQEGEVLKIDETKGSVVVQMIVFSRPNDVPFGPDELERI